MLYTVKIIKKTSFGFFKTKKIKNVEADVILDFLNKNQNDEPKAYIPNFPKRNIIDVNKNSYEINLKDNIIYFSSERDNLKDIKFFSRKSYCVKIYHAKSIFYRKIKDVVYETIMYNYTNYPIKVFITKDGERWEIPCSLYEFQYDKNKMLAIQDIMEQESGQKINAI